MSKFTKFNDEFYKELNRKIEAIEEKTTAEIVVAISPKSNAYPDTYLKLGSVFALLTTTFIIYIPFFQFHPYFIIIDIILSFVLGALIGEFIIPVKRLLIKKDRKIKNVNRYASAYFWQAEFWKTRERTAILFYISTLEKSVSCIADIGILENIPEGEWLTVKNEFGEIFTKPNLHEAILEILDKCEPILSVYMPSREDNPNELSNIIRKVNI